MVEGKTNRVVAYRDGEYVDFDIDEALRMSKSVSEYQCQVAHNMSV